MSKKIDLSPYCVPFNDYPDDLKKIASDNDIILPSISNNRGQALALMAQPEIRGSQYIDRETATKYFTKIGYETKDSIQAFNKDTGIIRIKMRGKYCLKYPFEIDKTHINKRKDVKITGDKKTIVENIKEFFMKNIINIPFEEWQTGHLDPTIDDSSEDNLSYQPPIQSKYRDRFKFDKFFHKIWPTGNELIRNIDEYYTEKEQIELLNHLKQKLEK